MEDKNKGTSVMGAYEIAPSITTEAMSAVFFDANALREPNYRLYQLNARGKRYYYINGEDKVELYPSVTTILKSVMPENKILTDWKLSLGREAADSYTMDRARFGSFVHGQIERLLVTRRYDLDLLGAELQKYIEREKLPISFLEHEDEAKCAIISFAKWMRDYDVRPLAVEICLYHPLYKFAGMLDLVCNMRKYPIGDKHGDERINAIVDFKTTTKEFHDEHAIQLGLYKMMWEENFPKVKIDAIANVSPKAWWSTARKAVSYHFVWQTENEVLRQIPYLLELYKLLPQESKKVALCQGLINLDEDVESRVAVLSLEELVDFGRNKEEEHPTASEEDEDDPFKALLMGD